MELTQVDQFISSLKQIKKESLVKEEKPSELSAADKFFKDNKEKIRKQVGKQDNLTLKEKGAFNQFKKHQQKRKIRSHFEKMTGFKDVPSFQLFYVKRVQEYIDQVRYGNDEKEVWLNFTNEDFLGLYILLFEKLYEVEHAVLLEREVVLILQLIQAKLRTDFLQNPFYLVKFYQWFWQREYDLRKKGKTTMISSFYYFMNAKSINEFKYYCRTRT